jgi:flagellar motor switch protein FliM
MEQSQGKTVLRRKLGPRADAAPLEAGGARHLSRGLARAISRIPGLVGSCPDPARRTASVPELLDLIDGEAFVALIADGRGDLGLAIFDPVATAALVEALTIGRLARTPPPGRRATQTDAQLLSEVIDTALAEYDGQAGAESGHRAGFRFQRFPADYRLLDLLLEAPRFELILQPVALLGEEVRRDGQFLLALPQAGAAAEACAAPQTGRRAPISGRADAWSRALEAQVMAAPAQLTAVLGRMTMPLSDVMALGVGSRVLLPLSNLEEVAVEALDGQVLGQGRLGQFRAMRAVRLTDLGGARAEPAGDFQDHSAGPPALAVDASAIDATGVEASAASLPDLRAEAPPARDDG